MLSLKPNLKFNWVGLAVSYHLLGSYEQAIKVLSVYEQTLKDSSELPFELGELLMYRNSVWEESGDCEQALRDLDMIEKQVVDKMAWKEAKGALQPYSLLQRAFLNLITSALAAQVGPKGHCSQHGGLSC